MSNRVAKPTTRVIGKPIAKMLSCGALRVRMPRARLVMSNAAMSGNDRDLENISTVRTSLGLRLREIDALQVTGEDAPEDAVWSHRIS